MDLARAVDAVNTALGDLGRVDLDRVPSSELRAELSRLKLIESRLGGHLARLTHAADLTGAFIGTGARDTAEWLAKQTGTSSRKNRAAAQLGEAMSKSDALADAVATGRLSTDKADAAVGASGDLPLDTELVDAISNLALSAVRPATEAWRSRRDAQRDRDVAEMQHARRHLRLTGQADGMTRVEGLLDPEAAAVIRATFDSIISHSAFDQSGRTRDQRCADALTQLAKAASKGEIRGGRSNAKLLATVPFETIVERAAGRGVTNVGPTLDADTVRRLACDAGIHRVITGPGSSILDFGHETRLVSENLFLALVARDQHCRWPGCTLRATWCDAHHVVEWNGQRGRTSERDCALLCDHHHHVAHQPGWRLTGDGHEFTVHHPDGSIEVSRPPGWPATPNQGDDPEPDPSESPPKVATLRADTIGGPARIASARPSDPIGPAHRSEQLVLA